MCSTMADPQSNRSQPDPGPSDSSQWRIQAVEALGVLVLPDHYRIPHPPHSPDRCRLQDLETCEPSASSLCLTFDTVPESVSHATTSFCTIPMTAWISAEVSPPGSRLPVILESSSAHVIRALVRFDLIAGGSTSSKAQQKIRILLLMMKVHISTSACLLQQLIISCSLGFQQSCHA